MVERHAVGIRAFLRQRLTSEADVDEAAAEAFARVWGTGINVGFMDTHTEFISDRKKFEELIGAQE